MADCETGRTFLETIRMSNSTWPRTCDYSFFGITSWLQRGNSGFTMRISNYSNSDWISGRQTAEAMFNLQGCSGHTIFNWVHSTTHTRFDIIDRRRPTPTFAIEQIIGCSNWTATACINIMRTMRRDLIHEGSDCLKLSRWRRHIKSADWCDRSRQVLQTYVLYFSLSLQWLVLLPQAAYLLIWISMPRW